MRTTKLKHQFAQLLPQEHTDQARELITAKTKYSIGLLGTKTMLVQSDLEAAKHESWGKPSPIQLTEA